MRTYVYVDGFNLYYRALKKNPQFKWLNVRALVEELLSAENEVEKINYYTARVSGKFDADAPRRQEIYFDALQTIPGLEIIPGKFLVSKVYAAMVTSPADSKPLFLPWPNVVRVVKSEEKGSDVNLGSHLIRDAFLGKFDVAVVITNDTDLAEPIRIVANELGKPVGIICPAEKQANDLKDLATFVRHLSSSHLARSQFPDVIELADGRKITKPISWSESVQE